MKFFANVFGLILLGSLCACSDTQEAEEISPATSSERHTEVSDQNSLRPSNKLWLGRDIQYCDIKHRIEFDVYDIDPEFTNPKNYKLSLYLNESLVATRSFDQYCTFNNTVDFWNLKAGNYSYTLTSTCTSQAYNGSFLYQGGYYGQVLYINQSLCD